MAKKSELEAAYRRYAGACGLAAAAEKRGDLHAALRQCEAALPFVRDAIAYQKRFRKIETPRLIPVERILRLAPSLFDLDSLTAVARWRRAAKPKEKRTYADLSARLARAKRRMAEAARVWAAWETGGSAQTPDEVKLAATWISLGALAAVPVSGRTQYRVISALRRSVEGKCPECGNLHQSAYPDMLGQAECPSCHGSVQFVLIRRI